MKNRIERLEMNEKYKESFGTRLLESTGGKLMQPGRMTTLVWKKKKQECKQHGRSLMLVYGWQHLERRKIFRG